MQRKNLVLNIMFGFLIFEILLLTEFPIALLLIIPLLFISILRMLLYIIESYPNEENRDQTFWDYVGYTAVGVAFLVFLIIFGKPW